MQLSATRDSGINRRGRLEEFPVGVSFLAGISGMQDFNARNFPGVSNGLDENICEWVIMKRDRVGCRCRAPRAPFTIVSDQAPVFYSIRELAQLTVSELDDAGTYFCITRQRIVRPRFCRRSCIVRSGIVGARGDGRGVGGYRRETSADQLSGDARRLATRSGDF